MSNFLNHDPHLRTTADLTAGFCPADEKDGKKAGWLSRLVDIFIPKEKAKDPELSCRINQVFEDIQQMKNQLELLKQELVEDGDLELIPLVKEVIDPLLRDSGKIRKALTEEETLQKYQEWTDNARMWVQLCTQKQDKIGMVHALAEHVIQKCFDRIDRDIQFIHEYIVQHVNTAALNPNDKVGSRNRLMHEVSPYINQLASLKIAPGSHSLTEIEEWKAVVDSKRDEFLHSSLHTIDDTGV